jgi:hypothetical protein
MARSVIGPEDRRRGANTTPARFEAVADFRELVGSVRRVKILPGPFLMRGC